MSQTETLLLVVLGFSLAALIFLFVGRFIWSLALRLGSRRMQRQVPTTVAELQTERDRLRAEYAMISQKLGARLEHAKTRMAEHMAEAMRNRNRVGQLVADLNASEATAAALRREIAELHSRATGLTASLAAANAETAELNSERDRQNAEIILLQGDLAERDRRLASLAAGTALPPPDLAAEIPAADDSETRLKRRIDELSNLSLQIAESRAAATGAAGEPVADSVLQDNLEKAARETADLQKELARLDAAWASRLSELEATGSVAEGNSEAAQPRGVANVISLANRIKSLQKDIARS